MGALKAAVLGCGPTGLLAAHGLVQAAEDCGRPVEVRVYSRKLKSQLFGCQYLHSDIPGLKLGKRKVRYLLVGDAAVYREKVYGTSEDVAVSPELLERDHFAWDIRAAYAQLWELYEPAIMDATLGKRNWPTLLGALDDWKADLTFSSLPAPVICRDLTSAECTFSSQTVWAMGDAPGLGRWAQLPINIADQTIWCSGREADPWYRISRVFGHATIEWPEDHEPPRGASRIQKPLSTTCQCNPEVIRVGRYGKWEKGVLAHTAYATAYRHGIAALMGVSPETVGAA